MADQLCSKFDIPLDDYPLLVEQKIKNSVRFFLGKFLRTKESDKEYMGLDRIENLFHGLKDCQAHLCEQLWFAGKKMEAKGVFDRSKLKPEEVNKLSKSNDVGDQLKAFKYDRSKDFKAPKDLFEPLSSPPNDYLRLPTNIRFEFIDNEQKIKELEELKGQRFIGVDAEWRPQVHRWQTNKGPATLQIAGKDEAYIIDMIKLGKSSKLDKMLTSLFQQEKTIIVGFGFSADLAMFRKHCPSLKFVDSIPRFIDAQTVYKQVYPDFKENGGYSLAAVCERVMEKKLCKKEQMSNWENRPLRYSQEHYGAMDAWVLGEIMVKMMHKDKKMKLEKQITHVGLKVEKKEEVKKADKKPKEEKKQPEEKKDKVPDPAKIKDYLRQIEYHEKKAEEYKSLLARAQEMQ